MKKNNALRYLVKTADKTNISILVLTAVQMIQGVCSICYALFLRRIINEAVAKNSGGFWWAIIGLAVLFLCQLGLAALRRYLDEATRTKLENRFKERLFGQILRRDYGAVTALHTAEWVNRLTNDTVVVSGGMTDILPSAAGMIVRLIGAVSMIIVLEPRFLWLILPSGVLLLVFSGLFRKSMKKLHKRIQEKDGLLRAYLQESIGNLLVVRSYAVEDSTLNQARERMVQHRSARMKRNHFSNICNSGFSLVMQGASVVGTIFCGHGILMGSMSYGNFTAVLNLIGQIQSPFANISGIMPRYYAMLASAERLMEVELVTEEVSEAAMPLSDVLDAYRSSFEGIGFDNVSFRYPVRSHKNTIDLEKDECSPLPEKVSLFIPKGEYVAFMGASGCGKSTALKLLMCIYSPDSGERYLLNGGQRMPLSEKWQRLFAYVPQGNHLMSGTIRDIISYANEAARDNDDKLKQALKIACAEFVYDLENGVDTELGERGTGLSEGQMQRIAIARAILSEHPILMLDECTSALDEGTEQRLLQNLKSLTDRTVIIITHRPAAIEICDKTMIFSEEGCRIEGSLRTQG